MITRAPLLRLALVASLAAVPAACARQEDPTTAEPPKSETSTSDVAHNVVRKGLPIAALILVGAGIALAVILIGLHEGGDALATPSALTA